MWLIINLKKTLKKQSLMETHQQPLKNLQVTLKKPTGNH